MEACFCVICLDDDPGRDAGIVQTVRDHGWCSLRVVGTLDFAYTVGLWHTFRRPEIVMVGLQGENMQHWLNDCVHLGRDQGWPEPLVPFPGVLGGFETQLRPVHESWNDSLFGTIHRFYRTFMPVQQLVWPDRNGTWPWEPDATPSSRTRQAFAWLPVSEHPEGGWKLVGEMAPGFPFPVGPDAWVLTTRSVLEGTRPVVSVSNDGNSYDVLDDRGYTANDIVLAFLGELVRRVPAVGECAELPDGQIATASAAGWTHAGLSAKDRELSEWCWKQAEPLNG